MATITYPIALTVPSASWGQVRRDLSYTSIFGSQAVEISAPLWSVSLEANALKEKNSGAWQALLIGLKGKTNNLALWNMARPTPIGTMRGTMLLAASASLGATTLSISTDGLSFYAPLNDAGSGAVNLTLARGTGSATFTRSTTATTINSAGNIVSVAPGVARSYYDPTTLAYMGYLSEGARTNLCLQSENFTAASWVDVIGTTATRVNQASAIIQGGNDCLITATSNNGGARQTITGLTAQEYTLSFWVKAGTGNLFRHDLENSIASYGTASGFTLDLATGVVSSVVGATPTVKAYNGGWLCAQNLGVAGAAFFANLEFKCVTNGTTMLLSAPQLEAGSFASSYIPTTTAAVTRNADILTYPVVGNISTSVGTLYTESAVTSIGNSGGYGIGGDVENWQLNRIQDTTLFSSYDGASSVVLNGGVFSSGTIYKGMQSWGGSFRKGTVNGAAVGSGAFDGALFSTETSFAVAALGGTPGHMTIKNVRIWQAQLPDATLQAVTGSGQTPVTLLQGDFLGIGSGSTRQVVMVTSDAVDDGFGLISVTVEPPLRTAGTAGASIVWDKPVALFRRTDSKAQWNYSNGQMASGFSLDLIEDWR